MLIVIGMRREEVCAVALSSSCTYSDGAIFINRPSMSIMDQFSLLRIERINGWKSMLCALCTVSYALNLIELYYIYSTLKSTLLQYHILYCTKVYFTAPFLE